MSVCVHGCACVCTYIACMCLCSIYICACVCLNVCVCDVCYILYIQLCIAINGANKLQLSAELDPSELQGTLCNDNKVKVICYMRRNNGQNVLLNHLNCKWTCTRGINNQKEGMTILSYEPMYILSKNLEVPAQCKCSCKDPQGGEDKTAYLNISGHGE